MSRFRKKPVIIDAVQWQGRKSWPDLLPLIVTKFDKDVFGLYTGDAEQELAINTLEGRMTVSVGDWIIKGVKGEFYPCKPDIFEATYESLEEIE